MRIKPRFGFAVEYVTDIEAAKRFYVDVTGPEMGPYRPTSATTNKSKSPTLENGGSGTRKVKFKDERHGAEAWDFGAIFRGAGSPSAGRQASRFHRAHVGNDR